jgi:hypothetical protein
MILIMAALTQIVLGGTITVTGIFNPFLIAGPAVAAIGGGLLSTLDQSSSASEWIGYQIVLGVGVGACLTIPIMLAGVVVKPKDVSTSTAIIVFAQSIGGAMILTTAQGIFQNELVRLLRHSVPDLDPLIVISLGASDNAKSLLPPESLARIFDAFVSALGHTFVLAVPIAGISFLVSLFQPWFRYHKPDGAIGDREAEEAGKSNTKVERKGLTNPPCNSLSI